MSHSSTTWLQVHIPELLHGFDIQYKQFGRGDFGHLDRVDFEGYGLGGSIDIWDQGWLGLHLYDYGSEEVRMHLLLSPQEDQDKRMAIETMRSILVSAGH